MVYRGLLKKSLPVQMEAFTIEGGGVRHPHGHFGRAPTDACFF